MNRLLSFAALFSFVTYGMDQKALITKDSKESTTKESYFFLDSLEEHKNSINSVLFNLTDPNELISNSSDGTIKIWDVKNSKSKITIGKDCQGSQFAVSYDGSFIAYGDTANKIKVIDRIKFNTKTINGPRYIEKTNGSLVNPEDLRENRIEKIVFHPKDSSRLISSLYGYQYDGKVTFFDINNDTSTVIKTDQVYDFALEPQDGNTIVVGSRARSKLYDIEKQQPIHEFDDTQDTTQIMFNPSDSKECIFYNSHYVNGNVQIRVFDIVDKKAIRSFYINTYNLILFNRNLRHITLHPNGKEFIITTEEQTHIFDALTGNFIESLPNKVTFFGAISQKISQKFAKIKQKNGTHTGKIKNSVVSPDGKMIATYSSDDTIKLWEQKK